jgi:hypothetical protein
MDIKLIAKLSWLKRKLRNCPKRGFGAVAR